jgi:uncharacterized membrane protein YbhN (UPF0104 family)
VTGAAVSPGQAGGAGQAPSLTDRRRAVAGALIVTAVIVAAGWSIYRDRHSFGASFHRLGYRPLAGSFVAGLAGVALTFLPWLCVLHDLGADIPPRQAARVYFVSQLGKYIPGSVWPVLIQMEAGRSRGASRRTMLSANLVTVVLSCSTGLIIACVLLPFYDAGALGRYWWSLVALPFLLVLMHPRALPGLLDRVLSVFHRPPLGERLSPGGEARAAAWSVASWAAYGIQVGVLTAALGHSVASSLLLSTGAMALAISVGVLFIPVPAGAGVRDVVLGLVLSAVLRPGQALAVVVAARATSICCDLVLALAVTALLRSPANPRPAES